MQEVHSYPYYETYILQQARQLRLKKNADASVSRPADGQLHITLAGSLYWKFASTMPCGFTSSHKCFLRCLHHHR
jgi:hypothetical protein